MPGMQKLHLEDALEDSPQMRSLLGVFEKDALQLRKYTLSLHKCFQRVLDAQKELSAATYALSTHLKIYEKQEFPLENDDSILISTLKQFTGYLDELSSVHQVLATQLGDTMMYPLNKFLQADLEEIVSMSDIFQTNSHEHENSLIRFMKHSKKKKVPTARFEVNEDLYIRRKKFHQTALHHFAALNSLQYKRKTSLLEPLIGYMHAQKAFFEMGRETVAKDELDDFLANTNASVQGVHAELGQETQQTVEMIDSIEKQSQHQYYGEPLADMPFIPPNNSLTQKAGYLFMRSKQLIATKWERCYFFIQGGNLMCQAKDELAGSLVLDLNEEVTTASPTEVDDRRYVFQVHAPAQKKTVIVQAENDREREEWICTINNIVLDNAFPGVRTAEDVNPHAQAKERSSSVGSSGSSRDRSSSGGATGSMPIPARVKELALRINPFDQSSQNIVSDNMTAGDSSAFCQSFIVRFLGSMEVRTDRGEQLVHETIRQIMAARAIHNVFKMTESHLLVSSEAMRLLDPANNAIRTQFQLQDISYWAVHSENKRLFGFITRTRPSDTEGRTTFACHVFECNTSGEEICHAISTATKLAFQALMASRGEKQSSVASEGQPKSLEEQPKSLEEQPKSLEGKTITNDASADATSDKSPKSEPQEQSKDSNSVTVEQNSTE